jgi:hypothetical protein
MIEVTGEEAELRQVTHRRWQGTSKVVSIQGEGIESSEITP